ncbi:MAG: MBL fold metallo-hydrolase [Gemmatimonadaceae bacterium]
MVTKLRYQTLSLAIVATILAPGLRAQVTAPSPFRVTLLGTGAPPVSMTRFGPSTLVEAGGQTLVFDAGRGAAQRLGQLGVAFSRVDAVFLTHLHSDHTVGLPDLWLSGWVLDRRTTPWALYGPAGTAALATHLTEAYAFDIGMRIGNGRQNPAGGRLDAHDVEPGVVYERDGVRVIAISVDHGPITPAYGYRVEYGGRAVVLSGDTKLSPNLITAARGANLIVHEVVIAPPNADSSAPFYSALITHTTPEECAEIFGRVKPALAVYSHIVAFGGGDERDIIPRTKRTYAGPVLLGEDLMSIAVGDSLPTPRPGPPARAGTR